jgi:hypothetical protein
MFFKSLLSRSLPEKEEKIRTSRYTINLMGVVDMHGGFVRYIFLCCLMCFGWLNASWSSPTDLSLPGQNAGNLQVAVDTNGNATAVWVRSDGTNSIVQSATKPFGNIWQTIPDNLSLSGSDSSMPQIAVDSNGNATAVWSRFNGTNLIIQSSSKPFGGPWQTTPDDLSLSGQDASNPQIAVDSVGNATVVWARSNGTNTIIQSSSKPFGGPWQMTPDDLSLSGQDASNPQIAVDSNGNATVVWSRYNGADFIIQASSKPFGGPWQVTPDDLSLPGQHAGFPQIAVDSVGNATVVWHRANGPNLIIQSSSKPFGGPWQATPDDLSLPGQNAGLPQIGVDSSGNATVVWFRYNGTNYIVQSSSKPFGGPWQVTPDNLSLPGQDASNPQIGVDGYGNVTAVWQRSNGFNDIIQASTKPFGGLWQSTPDDLSQIGNNAFAQQIAVDISGNATAVWSRSNGTNSIIQASTRFFGPIVTNLNPNFGPKEGGTSVTITGTDFLNVTSVYFGSIPASSFTVESLTTITAIAPPGTGTVDVTVTASSMTSPVTPADQYTYIVAAPSQFKGKAKHKKKKLIVKTKWNKVPAAHIVRYEIFARNKKITTISARKKAEAIIRLYPHHIPHRLSKKYRMYLHHKYKIRAIDSTGAASHFTFLTIVH